MILITHMVHPTLMLILRFTYTVDLVLIKCLIILCHTHIRGTAVRMVRVVCIRLQKQHSRPIWDKVQTNDQLFQ